jgi:hypothetical protein
MPCRRIPFARAIESVHVGEGSLSPDIACDLLVTVATVKAHVSSLLTELEVENRLRIALLVHDATTDRALRDRAETAAAQRRRAACRIAEAASRPPKRVSKVAHLGPRSPFGR